MDIQFKRLLLLYLVLTLGGLAIVGCAVTTSNAATVPGEIIVIHMVTPPPRVTSVSIWADSSVVILPEAPPPVVVILPPAPPPVVVVLPAALTSTPTGFVPPPAPPPAGGYQPGGAVYIVQTCDTLFSIAKRYGCTVEQIAAANGIVYPHYIQIGQSLIIPPAGAPPGGGTYVVRTGDNLYRIAIRYGLTVEQIAAANYIPPPYHIQIGQTLIIPGYGVATPTPWWTPTPSWGTPTPTPWWTPTPSWGTSTPTPWWTPTPITPGPGMRFFSTQEGQFSIQYPSNWRMETPPPWSGYFSFWAQETEHPLSTLIGVTSKPNGQRSSADVLRDYQNVLPTLLGTRLGQPSLSWEGEPKPFLIGGNLGSEQYGLATSNMGTAKIRLIAVVNNRREYMILTAAQPILWDSKIYIMEVMIGSFNFLP